MGQNQISTGREESFYSLTEHANMMLVVSIDLAPRSLVITTCIGVSLEVRLRDVTSDGHRSKKL